MKWYFQAKYKTLQHIIVHLKYGTPLYIERLSVRNISEIHHISPFIVKVKLLIINETEHIQALPACEVQICQLVLWTVPNKKSPE